MRGAAARMEARGRARDARCKGWRCGISPRPASGSDHGAHRARGRASSRTARAWVRCDECAPWRTDTKLAASLLAICHKLRLSGCPCSVCKRVNRVGRTQSTPGVGHVQSVGVVALLEPRGHGDAWSLGRLH
eukprot:scaffold1387_cov382-Prasinococcus_capsulatus_cf.AAC.13